MKKIFIAVAMVLMSFSTNAQRTLFVNNHPDSVVRIDPRGSAMHFQPGEILVKFKDEAVVNLSMKSSVAETGIHSVDAILTQYQVISAEKLFPKEMQLKSKVMLRGYNGQEFEQPSLHNIYKLRMDDQMRLFEAIDSLSKDPNVVYAEPNYILSITDTKPVTPPLSESEAMLWQSSNPSPLAPSPSPTITPNDPLYSQQWYIPAVYANEVWDSVNGSDSTQVIGILDTGVDWNHPDLTNKIWRNSDEIPGNGIDDDANGKIDDIRGWDWINNDNNPADDNSHGTHVAGIAAAQANNSIGISGVSWGAKIMPLKVFQSSGYGDAAMIAQGITYAKNNGATILNMSFGSYTRSLTMEQALASAFATCVLVAAVGNNALCIGPGKCPPWFTDLGVPFYPAALSFVLGTQTNASWSNFDQDGPVFSKYPELLNYEMKAPGTNILSTIPNGGYRVYQGTSMATPVISGCAAMYRKIRPLDSQELMFAKFIQSTSTYLNINTTLSIIPNIQLWFVSNTIVDTINGGDNDGRVDAGETIQLWFKIRNTGGLADSVFTTIRFAEFEDTTTAQIITNQAYLGSISAYATLTNQFSPLKIHISPSVVNAREICFVAKIWNKGSSDTVTQNIILTVENGEELSGVMDTTLILTADKLWIIKNSFKVSINGHLIIQPGTKISNIRGIINDGSIVGLGTSDSLIVIDGPGGIRGNYDYASLIFHNTVFQNQYEIPGVSNYVGFLAKSGDFYKCQFRNISVPDVLFNIFDLTFKENSILIVKAATLFTGTTNSNRTQIVERNNFVESQLLSGLAFQWNDDISGFTKLRFNNFSNIDNTNLSYSGRETLFSCRSSLNNSQIGNNFIGFSSNRNIIYAYDNQPIINLSNQYWETTNLNKIKLMNWDFWDEPTLPMLIYNPILNSPSDSAHGIVWKVHVNGKDAQDEVPDPVGIGPQKFDVYFNKPMDPAFTPQVSFGVRYPYNQTSVNDSGYWSSDHKVYTCYKTVQLYTGDGINRIRVSGAKDLDGWEIPIEDMRFEFVIQAAGSASMNFQATAGLGKVDLEWNNAGIPDLLGFNMYRFQHITDTTFTAPVRINSALVLDTLYTDYAVTPNVRYYYYYKVVNTDFKESDSSAVVSCIPLTAAEGDANGDLVVNVLDITTIIAYMLNQNPQPFIFAAGDVNNDNTINVLDVIGVVNIITGKKKELVTNIPPAYIYLEDGSILLKTTQPVAGLQFELEGADLDRLALSLKIPGFELATCMINGKLLGVIYSYSNKVLPLGLQNIIQISGIAGPLQWGELHAGDPYGNPVKVIPDRLAAYRLDDCNLTVYPNPFTQSTNIQYRLFETSHVGIGVYDLFGKLISTLFEGMQPQGEFIKSWNGVSPESGKTGAGVYIIRFTANGESGKTVKKYAKIVMIR